MGKLLQSKNIYSVILFSRPFACNFCSFKTKTKYMLQRHISHIHTREKPALCTECGTCFTTNTQLKKHIEVRHTPMEERKKIPCEHANCGKIFMAKSIMKKHIREVHGDPRCAECDILFPTYQEFRIHQLQHKGKVPQKCGVCHKEFAWKCLLVNHMKSHGDVTVLEPPLESHILQPK